MEDPEASRGVESFNLSTLTIHHNDSAYRYSHDVEEPSDLNNAALDNDEKALQEQQLVDWDGPDDPENPMNWASSKKRGAITIVSVVTMLS